ncbi:hypothetical protein [Pseudomonas marginalis]|uniref:hypothetical protein n=1 Tax=Pseudomonas marginalis TaxID=298 RepID=UPI002B1CBCEB|nr:hypothetical protein [Pseudomonas marginalis]
MTLGGQWIGLARMIGAADCTLLAVMGTALIMQLAAVTNALAFLIIEPRKLNAFHIGAI